MRVTDKMVYDMITQSLAHRAEGLMKTQKSISTGKRVNEPSDDPLAMAQILDCRTHLASMDQYAKNMDRGITWLKASESGLYEANELLARIKELVLSQVTGTATDETRHATAEEVAEQTKRARAVESGYLNQLVLMGYLKKERRGRKAYFFADKEAEERRWEKS